MNGKLRGTAGRKRSLNGVWPRFNASDNRRFCAFSQQIERGLKVGLDGQSSPEQRDAALRTQLLKRYGVAAVTDLPINLAGASLQASEEWGHQIFDATYTSLWDAFRRQHRAQQALSVVAPLLAVRSVSMALAGTDFEQHRDFASAAETYRRRLIQTMNDAVASNAVGYTGDAGLWSRVDAFEYVAPGVTWVLGNERWALTALAAWLLVAALSASVAVRRLQIL